MADQVRQIAAVIYMRMAEDYGVNLFWVEGKLAIALDRILTAPLKQSAFKQDLASIDFEQIKGPGRRAGGAEEMD